jgi:hypothetical protein
VPELPRFGLALGNFRGSGEDNSVHSAPVYKNHSFCGKKIEKKCEKNRKFFAKVQKPL